MDSLSDGDLQEVVRCGSANTLKFGSGQYVRIMKKIEPPAKIGSRSIFIQTDTVIKKYRCY